MRQEFSLIITQSSLPTVFSCRDLVYSPIIHFVVHRSMASLADAPDLVGLFSYSREDDEGSGGKLSN